MRWRWVGSTAVVVLAGCGEAEEAPAASVVDAAVAAEADSAPALPERAWGPGPWDSGWAIPATPQVAGDPEAGWRALIDEGYVGCGVPARAARLAFRTGRFGEPIPDREPGAEDFPYGFNLHVTDEGVELAVSNCLTCHAGRFNGELVIGLGTADADFTTDQGSMLQGLSLDGLLNEQERAEWEKFRGRMAVLGPQTVMRTVGTNPAEVIAVILAAHHDPVTLAWFDEPHTELPNIVVPSDPPPWWRAHKKTAMFYNGMARGDHRGTMQLASAVCVDTVEQARSVDRYFADIAAWIRTVRAPAYPFPVDEALAAEGLPVFLQSCAGCHGTYGHDGQPHWYPNLLIPLDVAGTDPVVALGGVDYAPEMVSWFNRSFYGEIIRMEPNDPFPGYMPPPLDGVWATGPFLHNGSVPTIELVLDSTRRPRYWRRQDFDSRNFDQDALGWPYVEVPYGHAEAPAGERKYIYDTTQLAHGNGGHTFGDHLTARERRAVLEYLKTL